MSPAPEVGRPKETQQIHGDGSENQEEPSAHDEQFRNSLDEDARRAGASQEANGISGNLTGAGQQAAPIDRGWMEAQISRIELSYREQLVSLEKSYNHKLQLVQADLEKVKTHLKDLHGFTA